MSKNKLARTAKTLTDDEVRETYNSALDGTINDAIKRHLCKVALGEACIRDDRFETLTPENPYRYPTADERADARKRLADAWNIRHMVY